jgi:hypothetical protein
MKLPQHLVAIGILAIVLAGSGYYAYAHFLHPPLVTTSIANVAPVSEAVYGTGTVEPERWAKVVPLQRRRLVELCRCEGQAVKAGQILGRQDVGVDGVRRRPRPADGRPDGDAGAARCARYAGRQRCGSRGSRRAARGR